MQESNPDIRIKTSTTADVFSFTGLNAMQTPSILTPKNKSFFTQDLKPALHKTFFIRTLNWYVNLPVVTHFSYSIIMGACCDSVALPISSTPSNKKPKFQCLCPGNGHLKEYADRLKTFTKSINWLGARIKATCREFADAGFYYLGDRDAVKCFYCNDGVKNWELTDDPFQELAKWYPLCEYILKKRSVEFVKNEVKKYLDLKRPIITNPASVQLVGDLIKYLKPQPELQTSPAFTNFRKFKMWQSINSEMDHGENVRILKTLGFGEAKIRRVLIQRYEVHDNNFYNFNDFL